MKIVVLKGSPRKNGSSNALADSFANSAMENGHSVVELDVVYMDIATFTGCILMRPLLPKMSFPRKAKHKDDGNKCIFRNLKNTN